MPDATGPVHHVTVEWELPYGPQKGVVRVARVDLIDGYTTADDIPSILAIAYLPGRDYAPFIQIHSVKDDP